jgi:hypothetical protein
LENVDKFYGDLEYITDIGDIYDHLAQFVFIWYIFSGLGKIFQQKSGNPATLNRLYWRTVEHHRYLYPKMSSRLSENDKNASDASGFGKSEPGVDPTINAGAVKNLGWCVLFNKVIFQVTYL